MSHSNLSAENWKKEGRVYTNIPSTISYENNLEEGEHSWEVHRGMCWSSVVYVYFSDIYSLGFLRDFRLHYAICFSAFLGLVYGISAWLLTPLVTLYSIFREDLEARMVMQCCSCAAAPPRMWKFRYYFLGTALVFRSLGAPIKLQVISIILLGEETLKLDWCHKWRAKLIQMGSSPTSRNYDFEFEIWQITTKQLSLPINCY